MSDTPYGDGLRAAMINCSLEADPADSHTRRLMDRVAGVLRAEGVEVDMIHARAHTIATGMAADLSDRTDDDWPALHDRVLAADILIIGTPIWLGVKSSVASLVIERLYASSAELNERGQYEYYGRTAGCLVTGNEDGVKACSMDILYALQHIGYTIPPQADAGWIGAIGPGPSYGDQSDDGGPPAGFDSEFTNQNATTVAWNLMHVARLLRSAGGFPAGGNQPDRWREVTNLTDHDAEPVT